MPKRSDDDLEINEDLQRVYERVVARINDAERQIVELREQAAELRVTARGLEAVLGRRGSRPTGSTAVALVTLDILKEGHTRGVDAAPTVGEIVEELARRKWLPDSSDYESAVRASIRRLRENDSRWRLENGRLRFRGDPEKKKEAIENRD